MRGSRFLPPVIMGSADGLTVLLGLLVSLAGQPHALVRASVGAGLAELVGMTAGQWLSDSEDGFRAALANGGAACCACIVPALPYLATGGPLATATSLALVVLTGAGITYLRPERGVRAGAQTFGILAAAAALCWAASLI